MLLLCLYKVQYQRNQTNSFQIHYYTSNYFYSFKYYVPIFIFLWFNWPIVTVDLWFPIKIQNIQGRQISNSLMVYYTKKITLKLSLGTSYKNMQLSWIYFPPFFSNEFLKKYFWDWWSLWVIHMCVYYLRDIKNSY